MLAKQVERQFGTTPLENADYGKIVNQKHFERLCGLIDESKVVHGGERDAQTLPHRAHNYGRRCGGRRSYAEKKFSGRFCPFLRLRRLTR